MWTRTVGAGSALLLGIVIGQAGFGPTGSQAQAPAPAASQAAAGQPGGAATAPASGAERTVWYFYTVKWGKQDEFLDLFQKNHYPLLKAQVGTRLAGVRTFVPTYHGDGRADWTFAVQITFKDIAALTGPSPEAELTKKLYPDETKFRAEEIERFGLLEAHWDVPLNEVIFETRRLAVRR